MNEQQIEGLSTGSIQVLARAEEDRKKRLNSQRAWNDADETSLIRVQKAFTKFEKFSERHAGTLTMAWAILKTIRGG